MKFKKAQVEEVDTEIDMSPMIDMVFLLLIFFIVASAVVDPNKPLVFLPAAEKAKAAEDTTGRVQISLDKDERLFVGSEEVSLDAFKQRIETELDMDPNIRLFLRIDKEVPYAATRKVMKACNDIGAMDLIFATLEK